MTTSQPQPRPTGRVFVSYASPDRKLVGLLVDALDRHEVPVVHDESLLKPGDNWPIMLDEAVRGAAVVVVVWSENAARSRSVLAEAEVASIRRTLVPVTLDGFDVLPDEFKDLYTFDLSGWSGQPEDPRITELANILLARLAEQRGSVDLSRFSTSMRTVHERLVAAGQVTALRLVDEVRRLHPEYGNRSFGRLTLPVDDGERRLVDDWFAALVESRRPEMQAGSIEGRMAVLALAEMDRTVIVSIPTDVLNAIAAELEARAAVSSDDLPEVPATEPVLVGGVDSDLVVWDRRRPLVDRLDVGTYVTMFATVIANRDTPLPLSIGLFGEWGSGKSYFMGLLQQQIDAFAADARSRLESPFYAEVVQVRFNAWHYADANLWASLAVELFEQLAGDEEWEAAAREQARTALLTRLHTYEEAKATLVKEERRASAALTSAQEALAQVTERQQDSQSKLDAEQAVDLARAIVKDPRLRPMIERAQQEASKVGVEVNPDDLADLHRAAAELSGVATSLPALLRQVSHRNIWRLVLVAGVALAVAGVVLLILPGLLRYGVPALIAAVTALAGAARPVGQAAAKVRTVLRHVEQTIATADVVWRQREQRQQVKLDALRAELERTEAERRNIADRVAEAQLQVEQTQHEIDELGAGRRLYRFIAERASSEDYRRQLGVVSLIRQDFDELTRRLRARREEGADPALPTVERIVLYIDDMDRCPPERVVQVLEAVHLLLAIDLFVVVVGVDPRWLLRSLQRHFRDVLTDELTSDGYWQSTPRDYLEKIFQIPFVLPTMTAHGFTDLLNSLVRRPATIQPTGVTPTATEHEPTLPSQAEIVAEPGSIAEQIATGQAPEQLDLTEPELEFFTSLASLVRTPRATKRMINIYRMLRVTRDLGPASQFLGPHNCAGDYQAIVQLLAILTGFPALFQRICWGDNTSDTWPLMRRAPTDRWSAFLDDAEAAAPARDANDWNRLVAALRTVLPKVTLPDQLAPYQLWAPRISRFTFALSGTHADTPPDRE
jgi:hypothetical protein